MYLNSSVKYNKYTLKKNIYIYKYIIKIFLCVGVLVQIIILFLLNDLKYNDAEANAL